MYNWYMQKTIKYFGFGTNKDLDMMVHIVGRSDLRGEPGKLIGYEVCIQRASQMRTEIPENSPWKVPPRDIITKSWSPDFLMYVSKPNPEAVAFGTIWDLTPEEVELVKEWECVEYGVQDEVNALALDSQGNQIAVETQSLTRTSDVVEKIITGDDYPAYIAPKDQMLKKADTSRLRYLKEKQEKSSSLS